MLSYYRKKPKRKELYLYLKNSLIIHEENTKEIMGVKESVYVIQICPDLHEL
jgi:hypothetical protein